MKRLFSVTVLIVCIIISSCSKEAVNEPSVDSIDSPQENLVFKKDEHIFFRKTADHKFEDIQKKVDNDKELIDIARSIFSLSSPFYSNPNLTVQQVEEYDAKMSNTTNDEDRIMLTAELHNMSKDAYLEKFDNVVVKLNSYKSKKSSSLTKSGVDKWEILTQELQKDNLTELNQRCPECGGLDGPDPIVGRGPCVAGCIIAGVSCTGVASVTAISAVRACNFVTDGGGRCGLLGILGGTFASVNCISSILPCANGCN